MIVDGFFFGLGFICAFFVSWCIGALLGVLLEWLAELNLTRRRRRR